MAKMVKPLSAINGTIVKMVKTAKPTGQNGENVKTDMAYYGYEWEMVKLSSARKW